MGSPIFVRMQIFGRVPAGAWNAVARPAGIIRSEMLTIAAVGRYNSEKTACFWIMRDGPDHAMISELWGSE